MGHYASEMDPNWGQPTISERKLGEVPEDEIRELAKCLFQGFDSGSDLEGLNAEHGIRVANAIDALVQKRIVEVLGDGDSFDAS
jgi:hypothetical protein